MIFLYRILINIIFILSPLIIILTITIDYYINKRQFTKNYFIAIFLIILGIIVIKKDSKKLDKLDLF